MRRASTSSFVPPRESRRRRRLFADVSPERIVVSAGDSRGLFYGAVTLWQLLTAQRATAQRVAVPALTIDDAPRFRWRGLMLDSARHYQSPEFIKQLIDVMALHKLNVLHWHLTDDQAWRLEIRKYPRLTEVGAWRVPAGPAAARGHRSGDRQAALVRRLLHAGAGARHRGVRGARHITIVPEIEMPGHASAAIAAYPQLGGDRKRRRGTCRPTGASIAISSTSRKRRSRSSKTC